MKANEIQIGQSYEAKVGPRWVEVQIVRASAKGGYEAKGANGKPVKVKDAGALRPLPGKPESRPAPTKAAKKPAPAPVAKPEAKAVEAAPVPERPAASQTGGTVAPSPADADLVPLTRVMKPAQVMKEPATPARARKPKAERPVHAPSGLEAAIKVLAEKGEPMTCRDLVRQMLATGLWTTDGKTPAATINASLHKEIKVKGPASRFIKTGRGLFALNTANTEGK